MGSFSKHVLDQFLAHGVSAFDSATIPDKRDKQSHWLDKYFLNNVLRAPFKEGTRQYVFNYLRRVEAAFEAHANARLATETFLAGSRQSLSKYMDGLLYWESFLAQSWMAYCLLIRPFDVKVFEPSDGSITQRLNLLYNTEKHADSVIQSGELPENGTTVIWMTNEGLKSNGAHLLWTETGEVLDDLAKWANALEDPLTAREKLRGLQAELGTRADPAGA